MAPKFFGIAVLVAITIFAAGAVAQENELTGIIGRTFISDQGVIGAIGTDTVLHSGNGLAFGGANPGDTGTNTGVLQMGVGLDVKILKTLSLRGQLRDFYSGVPQLNIDTGKSRQHNLFVGGGVVWHF